MIALGNGGDAIIGLPVGRPTCVRATRWSRAGRRFPTYLSDAAKQQATVVRVPLRDGAIDLDAHGRRDRTANAPGVGLHAEQPDRWRDRRAGARRLPGRRRRARPGRRRRGVLSSSASRDRSPTRSPSRSARDPTSRRCGRSRRCSGWRGCASAGWRRRHAIVAAVGRSRHYYDVGGLPALAALASLDDPAEVQRRRARERAAARRCCRTVCIGSVTPGCRSQANFVAVEVGDADAVAARLLAEGVATRSLGAVGAPGLLRVTVGSEPALERLLALLGEAPPVLISPSVGHVRDSPPREPPARHPYRKPISFRAPDRAGRDGTGAVSARASRSAIPAAGSRRSAGDRSRRPRAATSR